MQVNNQISEENISKKWLHAESIGSLFSLCSTCLLSTYQKASILFGKKLEITSGKFFGALSLERLWEMSYS